MANKYFPAATVSAEITPEYLGVGYIIGPKLASLNFAGGGSLNVPIGTKGRLTGDLRRTFRAARTLSYQGGVEQPSPASEQDYWNGRLELTWNL